MNHFKFYEHFKNELSYQAPQNAASETSSSQNDSYLLENDKATRLAKCICVKLKPLNQKQFEHVSREILIKISEIKTILSETRSNDSASRSKSMVIAWLKDIEKSKNM